MERTVQMIEKVCKLSIPKNRQKREGTSLLVKQRNSKLAEIVPAHDETQPTSKKKDTVQTDLRKTVERARKLLNNAINNSKLAHWRLIWVDVDYDPWGLRYKIVLKMLEKYSKPPLRDAHIIRNTHHSIPGR